MYVWHRCFILFAHSKYAMKEAGVRTARATKHKNHPYRNFPTDCKSQAKETRAFQTLSYTMERYHHLEALTCYLFPMRNSYRKMFACVRTTKANVFVEALIEARLV